MLIHLDTQEIAKLIFLTQIAHKSYQLACVLKHLIIVQFLTLKLQAAKDNCPRKVSIKPQLWQYGVVSWLLNLITFFGSKLNR